MNKLKEKAIERVGELLKDDIFDECVVVSDAERCYIEGYKDAQKETIDKVCKWLEEHSWDYLVGADNVYVLLDDKMVGDLKEAMEE